MLQDLYSMRMSRGEAVIDPHYTKLTSSQVEKDGMLTRVSEFKEVCVDDQFKQFNIFDFEIANILALGATNLLKPVSMVNHDVIGIADGFDKLNSSLNGTPDQAA